jgi:hypothetical protein
MTQAQLAQALKLGKEGARAVRRWEAGEREISGPVQVALELLTILRDALPSLERLAVEEARRNMAPMGLPKRTAAKELFESAAPLI